MRESSERMVLTNYLRYVSVVYYSAIVVCVGQTPSQCGRKDKIQMTVMAFKPQNSESTVAPLPHYECYLGAEDRDAAVSSSRPFKTRNGIKEPQPQPPVHLMHNNLPPNTAAYIVSLDTTNDNAFGIFTCGASKEDRENTTIFTIFLRSDGYIIPIDELLSKTVSVGDRGVIIDMIVVEPDVIPIIVTEETEILDIRWRINGSNTVESPSKDPGSYVNEDYELFTSRGIRVDDEGEYEVHGFLGRDGHHALQRLIVRSCEAGKWGPHGCNGICDNCYNGGVCDDETGRCICPPGFMGTNCLTACGSNRFGYSCEFQCDYGGNSDCEGRQFCLLDPYGCTCNTGYKQLHCMKVCEHPTFGAGCLQECHCSGSGGSCNRFTGVCDSGNCQDGWSGTNCQIPDVCPRGYFGSDCTEKCLCIGDVRCDKDTGECVRGVQCAPGAMKPVGSDRCQECPDGFYGDCTEECHCESDACDKATGECVGCCQPQWLEADNDTCQIGLEGSSFLKVNSGQSTTVRCEASQDTTTIYSTKLSRDRNSLDDSGISSGNRFNGVNNKGSLISATDFTINNVSSTDVFYCLLLDNSAEPVAWLNTKFYAYKLPVLNDSPTSPGQTNDSVNITWRAWDDVMDVGDPPVVSYLTYYKEVGTDMWIKGSNVSSDGPFEFTASGLKMDVNYTFSVVTVRGGKGGEGPRSQPVTVRTFCVAPAVPINVQASLTNDNKIEVSWQIPPGSITCSTGITNITIYASIEGSIEKPMVVATVGGETTSYIISDGLENGQNYVFHVSLTTDRESAHSLKSEVVLYPEPSDPGRSPVISIVIIIIIIIVLVLVIVIILVIVKRHFYGKGSQDKSESAGVGSAVRTNAGVSDERGGYTTHILVSGKSSKPSEYLHLDKGQIGETMTEYEEPDMNKKKEKLKGLDCDDVGNNPPGRYNLPKPPAPQHISEIQYEDNNYEDPGDFENYTGVYTNVAEKNKLSPTEPIKVSEFQSFMRKDKTELVDGILKEFMMLLKGKQYSCSEAEGYQIQKNNSQAILPYDHSRVKLTSFGNMNGSDYYNASYIKDHNGKVAFIASQGPGSKYKISDFWRMIWQEKVKTIVMLTDSDQPGGGKCSAVYWPERVKMSEIYGEYTIHGMELTSYDTYTVREIKVLQNNDDKIYTVQQIQLHTWPFRGVPEDISDLIAVIKKVKVLQGGGTTCPLLVHCSNGSGATGTFIAIYSLMDALKESNTISIFDFVNNMRKDRMDMVQTRIQYLFVYETLRDAQLFPEDTSLSSSQLTNLSDSALKRKSEREFKVLRKMGENLKRTECKVGTLETNVQKNRFERIIPLDKYRTTLKTEGLSHGNSDYINATIAETDDSRYTVMTQSPLPATLDDFWRLVYDYQCSTIVMLHNPNHEDKSVRQYWPDGKATYAFLTVETATSMKLDAFTRRTFTVTNQDFKESLSVKQLVFDGFVNNKDVNFDKLAKFMDSTEIDTSKTLVVHCINGVGLSAVYVVVRSQMESIRKGDECDVFLAVRKLRMRNPHAIQTQDEYTLCLQLLRSILNDEEEYAEIH